MTVPKTNVHVPPRPLTRLVEPMPCRFCGLPAYLADDEGALHVCCAAWRAELERGRPCPACAQSRTAAREWADRQAPKRRQGRR